MFGDELRLKRALPVAGNFYRQFAKFAFKRLAAGAVTGVAHGIGDWVIFAMPKVRGHFGLQGTLHSGLGELLEQAMLANQVFGFLVVGDQAVGQLDQWGSAFGGSLRYT